MNMIENKKIIRYFARKEYTGNWKRNLLTIVAIVLTTFLITTVCSLGGSYWKTVTRRSVIMEGIRYDVSLPQPTAEQVMKAYQIPEIKNAGLAVKCAVIREYKGKPLEIRLFWGDSTNWEKQCIPAFEFIEGTYPKAENEMILSTRSLNEMGIENPKIGMELPVKWESLSGDEVPNKGEGQFKLTGYYREYTGQMNGYVSQAFYQNTGAKQTDITQGMLYLTLQYSLYSESDIEKLGEKLNITERQMIYADTSLLTNFLKMISALGILMVLIFMSGYLFIYNILYISITKEVKHYGQLKALGMTGRQLERYVWWQIFWNLWIGIPLGLLLGVGVSVGIVPILLNGFVTYSEQNQTLIFHPMILAGAIVFSLATVWFGSYQPVRMAGKMSPIEAVRYTGARGIKKEKNTKNGGKISHMAWWNAFRDKKQAIVVVLSLFLAMTAFLTISIIMQGKSAKTVLNQSTPYDFRILNSRIMVEPDVQVITDETLQQLETMKGIKKTKVVYSQDIAFQYGDQLLKNYYKRTFNNTLFSEGRYQAEMAEWQKNPDYNMTTGRLVGIDESGFDLLNRKMGNSLDKNAFLKGEIAILFPLLRETSAEETVGEELTFRILGKEKDVEHKLKIAVQNINSASPNYYGIGYGPSVVISNTLFKKWVEDPIIELVDIDYETSFNASMDENVRALLLGESKLIVSAKMDSYKELYQTEVQMRILGNSLCIILAFLAMLNFGNLMAISIQNRRREFATLSSIGMTRDQTKKMLMLEGIAYAGMSIGLTIVVGIPLSYMIYNGTNTTRAVFQIPILENIFILMLMLLCCIGIPSVLYKILQKGSIIEQLRK